MSRPLSLPLWMGTGAMPPMTAIGFRRIIAAGAPRSQGRVAHIFIGAPGAGFPSPAQDWADDAINLVELLRLDRAASFVFRISGGSMIDAGLYGNDVVVVDRDVTPGKDHIVMAVIDGGFVVRQLAVRQGVP